MQLSFPGIDIRPTAADVKALVRHRLIGLELRQRVREERRARRRKQKIRAEYERRSPACL